MGGPWEGYRAEGAEVYPQPMADPKSAPPNLKAAGLKETAPRAAILAVLDAADRPLSVEEIRLRMASRSGIPTIYRNLERFVQEGWAEGLQGRDQVMRFVRCRSEHHHHHVQCEGCGRSEEVESCGIEAALGALEGQTGFHITRHHLELFGLCPACRKGE